MTNIRETTSATPEPKKRGLKDNLVSWLVPLLVIAWTKGKVILLFAMKSVILAPLLTFLLSWASYGIFLGWIAGLGLMVHLVVHEFGHYFASKWLRLQVTLPKFVPFMGAWVTHEDARCDYKNAIIALGGPTAGLLLSVVCLAVWYYLGSSSHFWLWMASTGFLLNLSNLIPVNPLDGGHVVSKIAPRLVAFTPYAIAFLAPAYGDEQIMSIAVCLLMIGGLFTDERLQLTLAAGLAVCALLWGPWWYLLGAALWVALAVGNVRYYVSLMFNKLFNVLFGRRATMDVKIETDTTPTKIEKTRSTPLSTPQRFGIGFWYIGLLAAGCPVGFWLFKLLTAHAQ